MWHELIPDIHFCPIDYWPLADLITDSNCSCSFLIDLLNRSVFLRLEMRENGPAGLFQLYFKTL